MRYRLGSIFIILLALLIRANRVGELGTQNDEGLHITIAERLVEGDVLYRDLFENRTPGVELVLAAAFRLAAPSILLGRFLTLGVVAITLAALISSGRLSQKLTWETNPHQWRRSNVTGWAAGLLFALAPLAIFWSRFTMLEHWQTAAATMAVAAALLAVNRGRLSWWFASGVLAGLSILAKQSGLLVAGVLLLYLLSMQWRPKTESPRQALGYWLAGLATPLVVFLVWLSLQGALDDFFHLLSATDRLAPFSGLNEKGQNLIEWLSRRPSLALTIVGGIVVVRSRRFKVWLPLLWATAELAALFGPSVLDFGWGGFSHYALPALAATSLLGGIGVHQLGLWAAGEQVQKGLAAGLVAIMLAMTAGWLADLNYAGATTDYPLPTTEEEERIGEVTAALTGEEDSILVLGNAVLYHRAGRSPANRFLHLPQYLPETSLWQDAETELVDALSDQKASALLVTRQYLEERLTPSMQAILWREWVPAALFDYPYQRGAILYLPKTVLNEQHYSPLAAYENGIALQAVEVQQAGDLGFLIGLWWSAEAKPDKDWTAFVHLLDPDGKLVAQHDGVPAVGFAPTSNWRAGEEVIDWHWIAVRCGGCQEETLVSIGLYDPATGQRSPLLNMPGAVDSFKMGINGYGQ